MSSKTSYTLRLSLLSSFNRFSIAFSSLIYPQSQTLFSATPSPSKQNEINRASLLLNSAFKSESKQSSMPFAEMKIYFNSFCLIKRSNILGIFDVWNVESKDLSSSKGLNFVVDSIYTGFET